MSVSLFSHRTRLEAARPFHAASAPALGRIARAVGREIDPELGAGLRRWTKSVGVDLRLPAPRGGAPLSRKRFGTVVLAQLRRGDPGDPVTGRILDDPVFRKHVLDWLYARHRSEAGLEGIVVTTFRPRGAPSLGFKSSVPRWRDDGDAEPGGSTMGGIDIDLVSPTRGWRERVSLPLSGRPGVILGRSPTGGRMGHLGVSRRLAWSDSHRFPMVEIGLGLGPPSPPSVAPSLPPTPEAPAAAPAETVLLGGSAPKSVRPGTGFAARFAAYVPRFERKVRALLSQAAGRKHRPRLGTKGGRWAVGSRVSVRLSAPGLEAEVKEQAFAWDGEYWTLDFPVTVPAGAALGTVPLSFDVTLEGLRVGLVTLEVEIGKETAAERIARALESIRSVFVSYAHEDREDVYERVASLEALTHIDFFVDAESLRMGEVWEPRLEREILGRDLFLLFWSRRAKASKWVRREWGFALDHKGYDGMQLHLLERVEPKSVPPRLRKLHLEDRWLRLAGKRTVRATPKPRPRAAPPPV